MKKFLRGISFAIAGIGYAFRSQVNMRFHVIAATLVIIASILFRLSPIEWCVVLFCIGSVIGVELINTSIETTIDIISPMRNEKAGQAKDLAAAAVLITCIASAIIGAILFVPKIYLLL